MIDNKCRGALVGGAAGDALGYEVEFMSLNAIRRRFGDGGIKRYEYDATGMALFSDDTQMTIFTLEGLMNCYVKCDKPSVADFLEAIRKSYLDWYETQSSRPKALSGSWLSHLRPLWSRRAPGMTCLGALESLKCGYEVHNNSKGCGGVMRVAPIGIFAAIHPELLSEKDTARLAGAAAEITHCHNASTLASALLALVVRRCILQSGEFEEIVNRSLDILDEVYTEAPKARDDFRKMIVSAMNLAKSDIPDADAIKMTGEGWVGDEAIAVAVYCVLRHADDFEACIVAAVNHDGDSDSTGAVAGNIIGAIAGYDAIPECFKEKLELAPVLVSLADDMVADKDNERLAERYVNHRPDSSVEVSYLI